MPIYEPLFADGSFGYRPGRSAKDAILKVKEYAEQGYTLAVVLDLSRYWLLMSMAHYICVIGTGRYQSFQERQFAHL